MIATVHELALDIGGIPILVRTDSAEFADMLADRYGEFVSPASLRTEIELEIKIVEPGFGIPDSGVGSRVSGHELSDSEIQTSDNPHDVDLSVRLESGRWIMERGDFRAEWNPESKRAWVRTSVNQYSIDGVLRILHSLILARQGGLLVHGASAVRNGRAFVFAGVSGTGKTTISRLAPPDVTLLTDEISYLRPSDRRQQAVFGTSDSRFEIQDSGSRVPNLESRVPDAFQAYGTPFAGELARIGVKTQAPLAGLFLLQQGPENRIESVGEGQAVRELMRHILFFAHDSELVVLVFQTVCDFVKRVPVKRLVFKKDASVWELIV